MQKFLLLYSGPDQPVPPDLAAFNEARDRLHRSGRTLIREADAFGKMIKEMQGPKPSKKIKKETKSK